MDRAPQKLPFVPPVEGCRIEHVHHVGPFVTRVRLRLPDGRPWIWTSRQHRFLGGVRSVPAEVEDGIGKARWWLSPTTVPRAHFVWARLPRPAIKR